VSHVDEIKEALEIIDSAREIIAAKLSVLELMLETEAGRGRKVLRAGVAGLSRRAPRGLGDFAVRALR
jgi:hypothetical protein